jgi:translation initiation factor 3 subunit C
LFAGPPESTRDIIVAASKALAKGDWKRCETLLLGLPVWNLLPKTDQVKAMLRGRIQEEGLRTFFFTYGTHYDSLSLDHLSQMFELDKTAVHQIISKMIINEELHGSWDQPSGSIIMHRVEPSRLQYLALQFADKASQFVENNERLLDVRTGSYGYTKGEGQKQQGQQGQQQTQRKGNNCKRSLFLIYRRSKGPTKQVNSSPRPVSIPISKPTKRTEIPKKRSTIFRPTQKANTEPSKPRTATAK